MQTFFNAKKKMIVLLIIMLIGFTFLAWMLLHNQKNMQHQLDTLYFGTFVPVSNLKEIVIELKNSIIALNDVTPPRDIAHLKNFSANIKNVWESYAYSYKSNEEKKYVAHVQGYMDQLYPYLDATFIKSKPLALQEKQTYQDSIALIIQKITQLINYETAQAVVERKESLEAYNRTKNFFLLAIGLLIVGGLALFIPIMHSISRYEAQLQALATQLHHASITDGLTGLFNRRYFDRICDRELSRAKREGLSVTFMMIDIDYFKPYNDHYGHPAGDEVIKSVATYIQSHFKRPHDLIFRLGGEEFGVLLLGTPKEAAFSIAQSCVQGMQTLNITHEASKVADHVTLSMGFSHSSDASTLTATTLYHDTDARLYNAKESGRNRVVED